MHLQMLRILLTILQKGLEQIFVTHQSEASKQNKKNSEHFWRFVNKIWTLCIPLIPVKLRLQWIKTLEIRAKSIQQVKN